MVCVCVCALRVRVYARVCARATIPLELSGLLPVEPVAKLPCDGALFTPLKKSSGCNASSAAAGK